MSAGTVQIQHDLTAADEVSYCAAKNLKEGINYRQWMTRCRLAFIKAALKDKDSKGVQKLAAKRLGISRVTLATHLKRGEEQL